MSRLSIAISAEDHLQGNPAAECNLVEYGDYQCPYCGQAYPVVKRLQKHFGDSLLFVFRNFPLTELHPWAEGAAETAEFAGSRGKFWQMHDLLFEHQRNFGQALFLELTETIGLSSADLLSAVNEKTYRSHIRADFTGGVRSGVNGTPTFFINGQRHNGPFEFISLSRAIERTLGRYTPSPAE
jgi:protein-disulfide isomerase